MKNLFLDQIDLYVVLLQPKHSSITRFFCGFNAKKHVQTAWSLGGAVIMRKENALLISDKLTKLGKTNSIHAVYDLLSVTDEPTPKPDHSNTVFECYFCDAPDARVCSCVKLSTEMVDN